MEGRDRGVDMNLKEEDRVAELGGGLSALGEVRNREILG